MVDVVDKVTRSRMMSGIRGKNTRPETFIRKGLYALGFRFRLHAKNIPGKPDIALPKYDALIEIYGCFWHGHGCRYCKTPSTNTRFWKNKIIENQRRDKRNFGRQMEAGWRCLVVWECAIRMSQRSSATLDAVSLVTRWLTGSGTTAIIDEQGLCEQPV